MYTKFKELLEPVTLERPIAETARMSLGFRSGRSIWANIRQLLVRWIKFKMPKLSFSKTI